MVQATEVGLHTTTTPMGVRVSLTVAMETLCRAGAQTLEVAVGASGDCGMESVIPSAHLVGEEDTLPQDSEVTTARIQRIGARGEARLVAFMVKHRLIKCCLALVAGLQRTKIGQQVSRVMHIEAVFVSIA